MPYIKDERRSRLDPPVHFETPRTCGELNFLFCDSINDYLRDRGLSYQTINDIIGALEGAKIEFYERVAKPYERRKLKENGDVWDKEFIGE